MPWKRVVVRAADAGRMPSSVAGTQEPPPSLLLLLLVCSQTVFAFGRLRGRWVRLRFNQNIVLALGNVSVSNVYRAGRLLHTLPFVGA